MFMIKNCYLSFNVTFLLIKEKKRKKETKHVTKWVPWVMTQRQFLSKFLWLVLSVDVYNYMCKINIFMIKNCYLSFNGTFLLIKEKKRKKETKLWLVLSVDVYNYWPNVAKCCSKAVFNRSLWNTIIVS